MKSHNNIILILGLFLSLLFIFVGSVKASPSNNPIFATIEQVQQMINNANNNPKTLKVFDTNGHELGLYVGGFNNPTMIFIQSLNRVYNIPEIQGNGASQSQVAPFFTSTDCSGTPYSSLPGNLNSAVNEVYRYVPGYYYIFTRNVTPRTLDVKSSLYDSFSTTDTPVTCESRNETRSGLYPLIPVTLPLTEH